MNINKNFIATALFLAAFIVIILSLKNCNFNNNNIPSRPDSTKVTIPSQTITLPAETVHDTIKTVRKIYIVAKDSTDSLKALKLIAERDSLSELLANKKVQIIDTAKRIVPKTQDSLTIWFDEFKHTFEYEIKYRARDTILPPTTINVPLPPCPALAWYEKPSFTIPAAFIGGFIVTAWALKK